jgi:MauM/NapG family ferredoxin protein
LANLALRIDPLAMLLNLLAYQTFVAGSLLALATVLLTLLFGRAWCGWLCPLGTLLDLFPLQQKGKKSNWSPPESWRGWKYLLLYILLVSALVGSLTLLVLDPLTLLFRSLATGLWPALDRVVNLAETTLYQLPFLEGPVAAFDAWVRPALLPVDPSVYRGAVLLTGLLAGVVALNLAAPRFWCRYLCPLGGLLGLVSKLALVRRQVSADCRGCILCTNACPTGTIQPERGYASDPGECTVCLDCLATCPRGATAFKPRFPEVDWRSYDPGRRQALVAFGAALGGVALLRVDPATRGDQPFLIRPPGVHESEFLSRCIRCGICVRACPTGGLQTTLAEAGLEGIWTPILMPRIGYCDYSCHACGLLCPVEAIPPLTLDEKRQAVIGQAYIDEDRCIAWADGRDCIVCEEMCPVPEKAIQLEKVEIYRPDHTRATVQRPKVLRERCLGCGICEYKCPVEGGAAIRVYAPNREALL